MRILSIDDSRSVHAFLRDCLDGTGYELACFTSGRDALRALVASPKEGFDLILLDWEMPEMTGPDVVRALLQEKVSIPVVMLTSKNTAFDIEAMLSLGVREYVMKPFTKDILLEKIECVLQS